MLKSRGPGDRPVKVPAKEVKVSVKEVEHKRHRTTDQGALIKGVSTVKSNGSVNHPAQGHPVKDTVKTAVTEDTVPKVIK